MADENWVRIFPAKACVFIRVTPALIGEVSDMQLWPRVERIKWTRRAMYPRHWTALSEAQGHRDPGRYISYRQALGPFCPPNFPMLAKDQSQQDLAQMSFAESLQKIHYRGLPWHQPLDGDGRASRRYPFWLCIGLLTHRDLVIWFCRHLIPFEAVAKDGMIFHKTFPD